MADDSDELSQYLDALPGKIAAELSDVIREQAEQLSNAQRQALLALEQTPDPNGPMAQSCIVTEGDSPLEYIVSAGGELTSKEVRKGSGVTVDAALFFEYGTVHQTARPFFWPTYNERRENIETAIADAVQNAIDRGS